MQRKILIVWCLFGINACFWSPIQGDTTSHKKTGGEAAQPHIIHCPLASFCEQVLHKTIALEHSATTHASDPATIKSWEELLELLNKHNEDTKLAELTGPEYLNVPLRLCKLAATTIEKNTRDMDSVEGVLTKVLDAVKKRIDDDRRAREFVESYQGTFPSVFKAIESKKETEIGPAIKVVITDITTGKHSIEDIKYSPYVLESIKILIDKEEKGNSDDGSEKLAVIQGLHDAIDRMTEINHVGNSTLIDALNYLEGLVDYDAPDLLTASTATKMLMKDFPTDSSEIKKEVQILKGTRDLDNTAMLIFLLIKLTPPNGKELYSFVYKKDTELIAAVDGKLDEMIGTMNSMLGNATRKASGFESLINELNYYGWYLIWFPDHYAKQFQLLSKYNDLTQGLPEEDKLKFKLLEELKMNERIHKLFHSFQNEDRKIPHETNLNNIAKNLKAIQMDSWKKSSAMQDAYEKETKAKVGAKPDEEPSKPDPKKIIKNTLNIWYLSPLYTRMLAKIEVALLMQNHPLEFVPGYHIFYP